MRTRRAVVLAVSVACVPTGVGVSASASAATVPADGLGFNVATPFVLPQGDDQTVRDLDAARRAGLRYARFALPWDALEPSGPGRFDPAALARVDRFVDLARARGIEPLPILLYTPNWAKGTNPLREAPPRDPSTYGGFAGRIASHFGTKVTAYQIWNEPNVVASAGGTPDPAAYAALLEAAYPTIKAANPAATVIAAGTSPASDGLLSVSATTFWRGVYAAGAKGSFDAAAVHPYSWAKPGSWTSDVDGVHEIMSSRGDGAKKIWITEDGISTATISPGVSEAVQRDYVLDAVAKAVARPYVGPVLFYGLRDTGALPADFNSTFGLLRYDSSPKPAFDALAALNATPAATAPAVVPCSGHRRVRVTLRRLRGGDRYVRVAVRVGAGKQRVAKGRRLRSALVDLRGLRARRYRVTITATTASGRTVRLRRAYTACGATTS